MVEQDAVTDSTDFESPGTAEVRIEMVHHSGQIPSNQQVSEDHVNKNKPEPRAASDAGGAGQPVVVEVLETVPLPRPVPWLPWNTYGYPMVEGDPWAVLKSGVDKFDKEMCEAWNGELDTILTFTGLFSAAVTAFCIESFQSLSRSPADTTNILLTTLSQQLANSSSLAATFSIVDDFTPTAPDVYINVLCFTSLTLSLSVSSVCILGKQWIREYQKDISVSARDAVRVRQARFDSLEAWKVPQIMRGLPVILLAALLLFFAGLLIQLWNASNHTTAIAVSVVVALTTLMVTITTVVPAVFSMQPRHMAFTPFRSPQAWIIFVMYRKFQQWYRPLFPVYHDALNSSANWYAFDLQFLRYEVEDWFEHESSSVHRSLQWIHKVLGNSSAMEKAVHWCFQKDFHPERLIESEGHLSRYVLAGKEENKVFDNPHRLCYACSERVDGQQGIDSAVGRYQAELLIRSAYHAMNYYESGKECWSDIFHSYDKLRYCWIFDEYLQEDMVHQQYKIQDQVALLLEKTFDISPPSHFSEHDWKNVIQHVHFLLARRDSSSPLSRQIAHGIINQQLPAWIRKHKSASLLYSIGEATCNWAWLSWKDGITLFTHLDKIMVEFCTESGEVEGLDEQSMARWRELQSQFTLKTRIWPVAPQHLQLSDGHFDALHGPLPSLAALSDPTLSITAEGSSPSI